MIEFYTDGACSTNGSWAGGWAVVMIDSRDEPTVGVVTSGGELKTTNNRMELQAVIEALKIAKTRKEKIIRIYTDSAYIVNCFEQGWIDNWLKNGWKNAKRQSVKNKDLWLEMLDLITDCGGFTSDGGRISIIKVKGHGDSRWNNVADENAVLARLEILK